MKDMLREKFQNYLKTLLTTPSQFHELGRIWTLSIINILLIIFLGIVMMFLSGRLDFFFIIFIMMMSAGSMVALLLIKFHQLKLTTQQRQVESKAYDTLPTPLLILTPDLHFCYGNKKMGISNLC